MTRGSPPSSEGHSEENIQVPPLHHPPPIITAHDIPPFGLGTSSTVGDTTPAPPSSPTGSPPPEPSDINIQDTPDPDPDLEHTQSDGDFDFPLEALTRLEEMLNRPRWVVPVLPNQELEVLLDASIKFKKQEKDVGNESVKRFFESGLLTSFQRLMTDDAVKDWKLEIQRYIYLSCVKLLELTVLKLEDPDNLPLLEVLGYVFNPKNRFHSHNMTKTSESTADKDTKDEEAIFAVPFQETCPKEKGLECLKCVSDEDLKKESKDNIKENLATDLALHLSTLYAQLKEDKVRLELESIRLKIIVRILKVASFAGRMNALSEIHQILSSHYYNYNSDVGQTSMSKKEVARFFVDEDLVGLALKDNLHQQQYVERVGKIVTDLLREKSLGLKEMDKLWDAQSGKHDAIQKNVHEMLTKLAWEFSAEQLEHLFGRFTESWKQAGEKERERLLTLIRQLAEDDKEGHMAERVLNLLWDLARDPELPLDIMEMALSSHVRILEHAFSLRSDQIRIDWMKKCVEQVKGTQWALPAMRQLQAISQMFPEAPNSIYPRREMAFRTEVVCEIQQEYSLVAAASSSIQHYMKTLREMQLPHGSTPAGYYVDKRYSHSDQIDLRLRFLKFLLRDGNLWLCDTQADEVWEELVVHPVFPGDRDQGFRFFARLLSHDSEQDLDPDITRTFFEGKFLQLDPCVLSGQGIYCFERFLSVVNSKCGKLLTQRKSHHVYLADLDLLGSEYLWKIILQAGEEVSERATDLFRNMFSRPAPMMYRRLPELHSAIIEISINKLRASYDTLQFLERDKDSVNRIREGAVKMTRVLRTLAAYVEAYDENYGDDRVRLPLFREALGRSFTIVIKPQFLGVRQEDPFDLMVHSSMTLGELRREIQTRMGVMKTSQNRLELFYQGTEFIDQCEDKKTFEAVGIQDRATIVVKVADATGVSSPDSSGESSPADRSPQGEEMTGSDWEKVLPSTLLSEHKDTIKFLFKIADLGSRLGESGLKSTARILLRIIPGGVDWEKDLVEASRRVDASLTLESLFFVPSPSEVLYTLEVAHALMLPAKPTRITEQFQKTFFAAGGLRLCLAMLGQNNFLHQADVETRQLANHWLVRLLKFNLFVQGKLLTQRIIQAHKPPRLPDADALMAPAHVQVLDIILSMVPGGCDALCRHAMLEVARKVLWEDTVQCSDNPEASHLETLMKIAWAAGSGSPTLNQNSQTEEIHRAYALDKEWRVNFGAETICREALECVTLCVALCPSLLQSHVMAQEHWKLFFVDILLSNSHVVRYCGMEQLSLMMRNVSVVVRELLYYLIQLLFSVLGTAVDERPLICREYFTLLQRLLEVCHTNRYPLNVDVDALLESEMMWLRVAKEYTASNLESFPRDSLLEGHLRVTKELMNFLEPERRLRFGSGITDNTGSVFVRELLEDFLLPSSKMYWEDREAGANMQRSSTVSADISGSSAHSRTTHSPALPRSVTTTYSPRRCVPVCGPRSTMAAYEAIVALANGCVGNMDLVVKTLTQMFYNDDVNILTEWEYQPQVGLRGASTFVGLKNGGTTCYMNSVFQQLFMLEPLREGILNAPTTGLDMEEEEDEDSMSTYMPLPLSSESVVLSDQSAEGRKEYDMGILRCIQLMFAHLLGSQLQFYVPRKFWKIFRFGNEAVNLREQHDAIEFFNLLVDSCDNALKELGQEMVCKQTFGGVFVNQIISKDCEHRRDLEEEFTSISVDVRNHNTLQDSLREYVKEDLLECDNAYQCEGCGNKKVSAIKRLCIKKLPPILAIQLKRFEYDYEREQPIKFNDYFEFPRLLDMQPYTLQGIPDKQQGERAETSDEREEGRMKYRLRGVVIHSGQANGGHYWSYIFLRGRGDPSNGKWYKFDDGDVQEFDLDTEEDLRMNCFGGEYQKENYTDSSYMKRMQPRRQKRWWNAYVLLYEQVGSAEKGLAKQLEDMTLSSRLREMPSHLEAIVRRKNTKFVHDRSQFTPEFFRFIKILCLVNAPVVQTTISVPEKRKEAKQLALLSVQLCSKFLFTTGLHARKNLRGAVQEWLEIFKIYFCVVEEARLWFAHHIFCDHMTRLSEFLLESTTTEVRALFQRILVVLAQYSKEDSDELLVKKLSLKSYGSLSNFVIWKVWELVCTSVGDMGRNASQLFGFFSFYATNLTVVEKEQVFNLGFPMLFVELCVEESVGGKAIKNSSLETGPCFKALLHLLRCCVLDTSQHLPENTESVGNPYMASRIAMMPDDLRDRLFADKFMRKLLESNVAGTEEAKNFVLFACWENLEFSKRTLQHLLWQITNTYTDTRPFVEMLESLLLMKDCWNEERLLHALKGDDSGSGGLFGVMQEDHGRYARRSYLLIKILTQVFENSPQAQNILEQSGEIKKKWINQIKWLHGELERKQFSYNFSQWSGCQSNEIGMCTNSLERTGSAKNIVTRAVDIIHTYCSEAEINDEEEEEEDDFTRTYEGSTAGQEIPDQPPPSYTDATAPSSSGGGVRQSQSETAHLSAKTGDGGGEKTEEDIPQSQSQSEGLKDGAEVKGHFGPGIQTMQTEEDLTKLGGPQEETKEEDVGDE